MKKGLCLLTVSMAFCLAGCASDEREGLVRSTVDLAGQVSTRLGVINDSIKTAMKKDDKALNLKEAEKYSDELAKLGKQLQENYQRIQSLKDSLPADEKAKFQEEFQGKLTQSILKGAEQNLALHETMQKLKAVAQENPVNKAPYEALKAKIADAQGQFETLARLR